MVFYRVRCRSWPVWQVSSTASIHMHGRALWAFHRCLAPFPGRLHPGPAGGQHPGFMGPKEQVGLVLALLAAAAAGRGPGSRSGNMATQQHSCHKSSKYLATGRQKTCHCCLHLGRLTGNYCVTIMLIPAPKWRGIRLEREESSKGSKSKYDGNKQ